MRPAVGPSWGRRRHPALRMPIASPWIARGTSHGMRSFGGRGPGKTDDSVTSDGWASPLGQARPEHVFSGRNVWGRPSSALSDCPVGDLCIHPTSLSSVEPRQCCTVRRFCQPRGPFCCWFISTCDAATSPQGAVRTCLCRPTALCRDTGPCAVPGSATARRACRRVAPRSRSRSFGAADPDPFGGPFIPLERVCDRARQFCVAVAPEHWQRGGRVVRMRPAAWRQVRSKRVRILRLRIPT